MSNYTYCIGPIEGTGKSLRDARRAAEFIVTKKLAHYASLSPILIAGIPGSCIVAGMVYASSDSDFGYKYLDSTTTRPSLSHTWPQISGYQTWSNALKGCLRHLIQFADPCPIEDIATWLDSLSYGGGDSLMPPGIQAELLDECKVRRLWQARYLVAIERGDPEEAARTYACSVTESDLVREENNETH